MRVNNEGYGVYSIILDYIQDSRGYFVEIFNEQKLKNLIPNLPVYWTQDNESQSRRATIRGLHYQEGIHAQAKLVRVLEGEVVDVALNITQGTEGFGCWTAVKLSKRNRKQLYIPKGFAHGFIALTDKVRIQYKCSEYYCKEAERGINLADSWLRIPWRQFLCGSCDSDNHAVLFNPYYSISDKDYDWPTMRDAFGFITEEKFQLEKLGGINYLPLQKRI